MSEGWRRSNAPGLSPSPCQALALFLSAVMQQPGSRILASFPVIETEYTVLQTFRKNSMVAFKKESCMHKKVRFILKLRYLHSVIVVFILDFIYFYTVLKSNEPPLFSLLLIAYFLHLDFAKNLIKASMSCSTYFEQFCLLGGLHELSLNFRYPLCGLLLYLLKPLTQLQHKRMTLA